MKVVAYDPFLSEERAVADLGVTKVELDELLARPISSPCMCR
jgi:phosphoglycerate dehydrogenase-like enzyme